MMMMMILQRERGKEPRSFEMSKERSSRNLQRPILKTSVDECSEKSLGKKMTDDGEASDPYFPNFILNDVVFEEVERKDRWRIDESGKSWLDEVEYYVTHHRGHCDVHPGNK